MHEGSPEARLAQRMPEAWAKPDDPVMGLLGAGLPPSLIMDLVMPAGPHSEDLLEAEPADDPSWLEGL
jgi:hypothetical protein